MSKAMDELLAVMKQLRDPEDGCPWDLEQNFDTIAPYTIEEAYEVAEAIANKDYRNLEEELGDLLLQVVFHSQMASEQGLFDFDQVAQGIREKLIRRHPHVFTRSSNTVSASQVSQTWDAIKAQEKQQRGEVKTSHLDGVSNGLPAMVRAEKLQKKAAKVGFDWDDPKAVIAKLREEIDEVEEAILGEHSTDAVESEVGDVLFCVVNLARHLKLDAEHALRRTNNKFVQRFQFIEQELNKQGIAFENATLDDLEAIWVKAKTFE